MESVGKIALGVGCGILLAAGALMVTCAGCATLMTKGYVDSVEKEREALSGLEFEDLQGERHSSGYFEVTGKVRNNGKSTPRTVKVGVKLKAKDGTVVDTDYTYVVVGEGLKPGEAKSFSVLMPPAEKRATDFECFVEP